MKAHKFKLVPERKFRFNVLNKVKKEVVFTYHCYKCDSSINYKQKQNENEINRVLSDPVFRFPCIEYDEKV